MKSKPHTNKNRYELPTEGKPRILKKNYHVTSQTAYHITQLALEENTSEGRIIDKLILTLDMNIQVAALVVKNNL